MFELFRVKINNILFDSSDIENDMLYVKEKTSNVLTLYRKVLNLPESFKHSIRKVNKCAVMAGVLTDKLISNLKDNISVQNYETGIVLGSFSGTTQYTSQFDIKCMEDDPAYANPIVFPNIVPNSIPSLISIWNKINGPVVMINDSICSTMNAIQIACEQLLCGSCKNIITGGCEEVSENIYNIYAVNYKQECSMLAKNMHIIDSTGLLYLQKTDSDSMINGAATICGIFNFRDDTFYTKNEIEKFFEAISKEYGIKNKDVICFSDWYNKDVVEKYFNNCNMVRMGKEENPIFNFLSLNPIYTLINSNILEKKDTTILVIDYDGALHEIKGIVIKT